MKLKKIAIAVFAVAICVCIEGMNRSQSAYAEGSLVKDYDWIVLVKTRKLERQFQYEGSTLKNVVECKVTYKKKDDDQFHDYESLWYVDGKAYGLERRAKFEEVKAGEGVCLQIDHEDPTASDDEFKASANMIARILVDCHTNRNPLEVIEVKDDSFSRVSQEMQNHGWQQYQAQTDKGSQIKVNIFIRAKENTDMNISLSYEK